MSAFDDNYLVLGEYILDRLRSELKCHVMSLASDEEMAAALSTHDKCVFVVYAGDIDDTPVGGIPTTDITQSWLVLFGMKRSVGKDTHKRDAAVAGSYLSAIRRLLVGQVFADGMKPVKQRAVSSLHGRPTYTNGAFYAPMYFTSTLRLKSGTTR